MVGPQKNFDEQQKYLYTSANKSNKGRGEMSMSVIIFQLCDG